MISSPRLDLVRTVFPCLVGTLAFFLGHNLVGALGGFLGLVLFWLPAWRRIKTPDITVCVGFGVMAVAMIMVGEKAVAPVRIFIIPCLLSGMAFGSLLLNRPFTLAYAKEEAAQEMWALPSFMIINKILTGFWGFVFLSIVFCLYFSSRFGDFSGVSQCLFPALILLGAFQFTSWYPHWHAKKFQEKPV